MQDKSISLFFKFIRICLGGSTEGFPVLQPEQWQELYTLSQKHAIKGVLFKAIEALPKDKRPPRNILFKWLAAAEQIKNLNLHLNYAAKSVEGLFRERDFKCCLLKGQGIAMLYPHPELRTPGDIDIWVNGNKRDIISFVRSYAESTHIVYHHIDGLKIEGVDIEVHFTPSYMSNPFTNKILQRWICKEASNQFNNCITIRDNCQIHTPTLAFNRVFILHHIYRHFFYEGIGLRQMMDFYYVLKQGFSEEEQKETISLYKKLNILEFAGATIYVLQKIFGLEKEYFITSPNEKYGEVLLSEIMQGGNFGQAIHSSKTKENKFQRGWRIINRSWSFFKYEPAEIIWIPYFKIMNNLFYVRTHKSK